MNVAFAPAVLAFACVVVLAPTTRSAANGDAPSPDPCAPTGLAIRVTVRNVEDSVGLVTVDLYGDDPEKFLKKEIAKVRVPAVAGTTTACLPIHAPGRYAVGAYHDRNGDHHLDKNILGIPSERVGVSNDPGYFFRMPRFDEASFVAGIQGADVVVTLGKLLG
jgi:uncharacterized protein (DUF2141 family)